LGEGTWFSMKPVRCMNERADMGWDLGIAHWTGFL
jgi:hypothetical protein